MHLLLTWHCSPDSAVACFIYFLFVNVWVRVFLCTHTHAFSSFGTTRLAQQCLVFVCVCLYACFCAHTRLLLTWHRMPRSAVPCICTCVCMSAFVHTHAFSSFGTTRLAQQCLVFVRVCLYACFCARLLLTWHYVPRSAVPCICTCVFVCVFLCTHTPSPHLALHA